MIETYRHASKHFVFQKLAPNAYAVITGRLESRAVWSRG
jgi:hypothetical protein